MADCDNSETRHKTLEEIARDFGDKVVTLSENEVTAEQTVFEQKGASSHIEGPDLASKIV